MIRILDAKEMELEYIKDKYPVHWKVIDLDAREVFNKGLVIRALTKCIFGFNQYGTKDMAINKTNITKECSRCSKENKDQKYIIKCKKNRYEKVEFIK